MKGSVALWLSCQKTRRLTKSAVVRELNTSFLTYCDECDIAARSRPTPTDEASEKIHFNGCRRLPLLPVVSAHAGWAQGLAPWASNSQPRIQHCNRG